MSCYGRMVTVVGRSMMIEVSVANSHPVPSPPPSLPLPRPPPPFLPSPSGCKHQWWVYHELRSFSKIVLLKKGTEMNTQHNSWMRPFRITPCKKPCCLLFLPRTDQCHAACVFVYIGLGDPHNGTCYLLRCNHTAVLWQHWDPRMKTYTTNSVINYFPMANCMAPMYGPLYGPM